jgi:formiminotetrahydrofolate cyclodeaminase
MAPLDLAPDRAAQRPANQGERQVWEEKLAKIRQLTTDLDRLREEDVRAYALMAQVRASGSRGPEWQEAVEYAMQVPREIMAKAAEALVLADLAGARCKKHLVSDLRVAQEFLLAALQGAHHIARANLPLVADEARREDLSRKLDKAAKEYQRVSACSGG